jgi:hypothetical protein
MKPKLDMDKIAKGLGAERRGPVPAGGGYPGALQLAAEVQDGNAVGHAPQYRMIIWSGSRDRG